MFALLGVPSSEHLLDFDRRPLDLPLIRSHILKEKFLLLLQLGRVFESYSLVLRVQALPPTVSGLQKA